MTWALMAVRDVEPQAVAAALGDVLGAQGFQPYDPFPGGAGTPPGFKAFVRLFVSPPVSSASGAWVRILGESAADDWPALFEALMTRLGTQHTGSQAGPYAGLWAVLSADEGDSGLHNLEHISAESARHAASEPAQPGSAMPAELEQLARARNVNPEQARGLFDRLTRTVLSKLDRQAGGEASAMQFQARAMLQGGQAPNWESSAGGHIRDLLDRFGVAREPGFAVVRDAYQVARRLQKRPNASLLDDERAALRALPDVLAYIPVYVGK